MILDVLVNTHFAVAQSMLLQLVANLVKTLFVKIIQKKKNQTLTKEKDISLHVMKGWDILVLHGHSGTSNAYVY